MEFAVERTREPSPFGGEWYFLRAEHGSADLTFSPSTGLLLVANIDVDTRYRRQGIGTALLHETLEIAEEVGAKAIIAGLISKASVGLFGHVFGAETITFSENGGKESGSCHVTLA